MKIGFIQASIDEKRKRRQQGRMTFIYGERGQSICGVAQHGAGTQFDMWSGYMAAGLSKIKVVAAGSPKDFWDTAWKQSRALPRWKQILMNLTAAWWRLTWRMR